MGGRGDHPPSVLDFQAGDKPLESGTTRTALARTRCASARRMSRTYDRPTSIPSLLPMTIPALRALAPALVALVLSSPAVAQTVRYFQLPERSAPHDVAPAPDGTVWYTAQRTGHLGRLDPKTGTVEEIPLGRGSSPHGVIVGPDGAAWVTDSGQNAIVRVDPATRAVQIFAAGWVARRRPID